MNGTQADGALPCFPPVSPHASRDEAAGETQAEEGSVPALTVVVVVVIAELAAWHGACLLWRGAEQLRSAIDFRIELMCVVKVAYFWAS